MVAVESEPTGHGGRYGRPPRPVAQPGATVLVMTGRIKDMDRWLGDGGMELIGTVGASFDDYGVDGEDLGWVTGAFVPDRSRPATRTGSSRPASTASCSTRP